MPTTVEKLLTTTKKPQTTKKMLLTMKRGPKSSWSFWRSGPALVAPVAAAVEVQLGDDWQQSWPL